MEGQGATVMRTAPANINKPGGSSSTLFGCGQLFIDSTGDILKLKLTDDTVLRATVGGVNVVFIV